MSNPFATFRKNQNYWMAGLVLLSILAFVVAPAIMQIQQSLSGGGAGGAVVVRWNGGKMTVADMQNAVQKHGALVRFLSDLAQEVVEAGGQPKVPFFFYDPQSKQFLGLGIETNSDEESVARTRILAEKAKRLGVEFSDAAIDEFILAFCDGKVATARIGEILREASGSRLSNFDVRELLKQELASMVVRRTASTGFAATVPGEAYEDFLKLNRTAKVEAFPVYVADYVDKVQGQPTETEIQSIYDLGSTRVPDPNSPDPAFVRPYQANMEFVESNMQQWVEREKAKLTEEQLRAEYDRMVKLEQLKVPVDYKPPASGAPAEENTGNTNDSAATSTPAAPEAATTEPAPSAPVTSETETSETSSGDAAPTEPAPNEPAPAAGELNLDPPAAPASSDGSALPSRNSARKVRLVAALQDDAAETPPPVEQPPQLSTEASDAAAAAAADQSSAAPAMRTMTFEEAREQIADNLARSAAIPALDIALTSILDQVMKPYYGEYRQYAAFRDADLAEGTKKLEEPRRPNLKKLAEDAGLTYGVTGLTDGFKLFQTQFGKSQIREPKEVQGVVANAAMSPQLPLFQPMQSSYFDQEALQRGGALEFFQYMFWKTEERPVQIPQLSEVRAEVVDYWKRLQARKLTETAAAALAKKISGTGETPWKEALSTSEQSLVVETDPFSWITRMGDFNMPTAVNSLQEAVGSDFMRAVFSAKPETVTVAPSENKSVYYVVRVISFSPDEAELQQRFSADPDKRGPLSIAQEENSRLVQDWYQNLYDEMDVKFEIAPNQL